MIYLCGAPPHQDMWDLKMDAPLEIRGPYKPISTNVPGIQISEHSPRLARMMDKLVPIRSMWARPTARMIPSFVIPADPRLRTAATPPPVVPPTRPPWAPWSHG